MAKYKDFCGFRFGSIHSSDLHLVVVSSSSRYEKNLLPDSKDYTEEVPGGDGSYYFGSTFNDREFQVSVAFDEVDEPTFRKISQLFATDKLQDLVFDELPYKTYRAKIKQKPEFKFICFTDQHTGERVYKGEGDLTFQCPFPYAFGFNKYVVRAADYYLCNIPEKIIVNSIEENPYIDKKPPKMLPKIVKDHYNVYDNMNTVWKGGYPTIEQVQAGELYFNLDGDKEKKMLIDVRGYWRNVPEWESTAKLLTTPTLDFDRELIFLPQYNKINYMNMDTGLNNEQGLIGSRILVYNPGDVPVEFELKLGNLKKRFRGEDNDYRFRISRYNVERLLINCAVDWTGLKTASPNEDEVSYKYGNRYFKILETDEEKNISYRLLKTAHPRHTYYVEPIPRQRLAHYIKMFHWQSYKLGLMDKEQFLKGARIANRYNELYKLCITDLERYELYWDTLKTAILMPYKEYYGLTGENEELFTQLCENYFQCPPEYFKEDSNFERKYGQFDFNLSKLPIYITDDYFEITTKGLWDNPEDDIYLEASNWGAEKEVGQEYNGDAYKYREQRLPHDLYLNTEKRMLYNINEPEWDKEDFQDNLEEYGKEKLWENYDDFDNFYNYKPTKTIRNESIVQGHWFKLPPGWSLIDISPVIDERRWGGKLWKDGRPFDWADTSDDDRNEFDKIYTQAARDYLKGNCPAAIKDTFGAKKEGGEAKDFDDYDMYDLEECLQFRRWYGDESTKDLYTNNVILEPSDYNKDNKLEWFRNALYHKMNEDAEYGFLKRLSSFWIATHKDENNKVIKDKGIDSWWWYACNYIWANFPPLYWGYMDLLNEIQIKYIPLFY